jgi:hypothetical protein
MYIYIFLEWTTLGIQDKTNMQDYLCKKKAYNSHNILHFYINRTNQLIVF